MSEISLALDIAWNEWMKHNLEMGCQHQDMIAAMVAGGVEESRARHALHQFQYLLENQKDPGWTPCAFPFLQSTLPTTNIVDLGDIEARLLIRLQRPDLAFYENVLSAAECDELIELARRYTSPSKVISADTGRNVVSEGRTSSNCSISKSSSPLIKRIDERIAKLVNWPIERGEPLLVVNYERNQEYEPHYDFFYDNYLRSTKTQGGQRVGTLLLYLNDVAGDGGTHFPHVGLTVTPRKGCALYFAYTRPDGDTDKLSLHAGLPVSAGEKWVAVKSFREGPFGAEEPIPTATKTEDALT